MAHGILGSWVLLQKFVVDFVDTFLSVTLEHVAVWVVGEFANGGESVGLPV